MKLKFYGTGATMPFEWRQMVDFAQDVYFFGAPVDGVRNYGRLFRSCWTEDYARQIYYTIGQETTGDSFSSLALSNAYKDAIIGIKEKQKRQAEERNKLLQFNEHEKTDKMFSVFDQMCRRQLFETIVQCRDTNQPIVDMACFDAYVQGDGDQPAIVERFMPRLWAHMCSLRNVKGNRTKADKDKILPKYLHHL